MEVYQNVEKFSVTQLFIFFTEHSPRMGNVHLLKLDERIRKVQSSLQCFDVEPNRLTTHGKVFSSPIFCCICISFLSSLEKRRLLILKSAPRQFTCQFAFVPTYFYIKRKVLNTCYRYWRIVCLFRTIDEMVFFLIRHGVSSVTSPWSFPVVA